jgi:hypothetical protein
MNRKRPKNDAELQQAIKVEPRDPIGAKYDRAYTDIDIRKEEEKRAPWMRRLR